MNTNLTEIPAYSEQDSSTQVKSVDKRDPKSISEKARRILASLAFVMTTTLTGACSGELSEQRPVTGSEIVIPSGYEFAAAFSQGNYGSITTVLCEEQATGKIFLCSNGEIGNELVIPEGYRLVGASAVGDFFSSAVYWLQNVETGKVFRW